MSSARPPGPLSVLDRETPRQSTAAGDPGSAGNHGATAPDADRRSRGGGRLGLLIMAITLLVLIFLTAAVLAHVALRYTRYGRQVYAVGGNSEAARLSGLNVNRVIASVYVIMGFFAGLSAFV